MKRTIIVLALVARCLASANAQQAQPLTLRQTIALPGVMGRFDHFAIDEAGERLFAAATSNHSVEVIDLKTGKVQQSLAGLGKPHGLAWVAATGSLYVADGALGELRVYTGAPLRLAGTLKLSDDADDMVYDSARRLLFVGHGGSDAANPAEIAVVNTDHLTLAANLNVATHPEALTIDPQGQRIFANIADSNEVAVIGAGAESIAARWKLTRAADNVPLAYDDEDKLLYVACRKPGMLIALDAGTGAEIASLPAAGKADDLFYDAALRRVYVISGDGEVDAFQVDGAKRLDPIGVVHTVPGAKTALFVPAQRRLYVGIPSVDEHPAEVRVYAAAPIGESR